MAWQYYSPNDDLIADEFIQSFGWGYAYDEYPRNKAVPHYTSCMTNNEGPHENQFKPCKVSEVGFVNILRFTHLSFTCLFILIVESKIYF